MTFAHFIQLPSIGRLIGPLAVCMHLSMPALSAVTAEPLFTRDTVDGPAHQARFQAPQGVATGPGGVVYVADTSGHRIRMVSAAGDVSTLAGDGLSGFEDGVGTSARFSSPAGIVVGSDGMIYVSEQYGNRIRRITPAGEVATLTTVGTWESANLGQVAEFQAPLGLAVDADDTLYVAESKRHVIRRITKHGDISILAGTESLAGFADGPASTARFNTPTDVALDPQGLVYVTDQNNHRIRRILADGTVETFVGGAGDSDVGPIPAVQLRYPLGVECRPDGALYVSEAFGNRVRFISPDGMASIVAGSSQGGLLDGPGITALLNGPRFMAWTDTTGLLLADSYNDVIRAIADDGSVGTFSGNPNSLLDPDGVAADPDGGWWVADTYHHRILHIGPDRAVTVWAGVGAPGWVDGPADEARFHSPVGLARGAANELYVSEIGNHTVRKITADRIVSTVAGGGTAGFADGAGTAARFSSPNGLTTDPTGRVFVADRGNHRVRLITAEGEVGTYSGSGTAGYLDAAVAEARFRLPSGVALAPDGTLYVADSGNNRIRFITTEGAVGTLGGADLPGGTDGTWNVSRYATPHSIAIAPSGYLYVSEQLGGAGSRLRRVTPAGASSSVTWGPTPSLETANGVAISPTGQIALVSSPYGKVITLLDPLEDRSPSFINTPANTTIIRGTPWQFVLDTAAHPPATYSMMDGELPPGITFDVRRGTVSGTPTRAGIYSGTFGATNSLGTATQSFLLTIELPIVAAVGTWVGGPDMSELAGPRGLAPLPDGGWLVADSAANRIRRISPDGEVSDWAGSDVAGFVNGPGELARFSFPIGIAVAPDGTAFVSDRNNNAVRRISGDREVSTLAGTGAYGFADGTGSSARFDRPTDVELGPEGTLYVADWFNNRVRKITPDGTVSTLAGNGRPGLRDGGGVNANLNGPAGLAWVTDKLYVTDQAGIALRTVTAAGWVQTISYLGYDNPDDVVVDSLGRIYTSGSTFIPRASGVQRVANGRSTSFAGSSRGYRDGLAGTAQFDAPAGMVIDARDTLWIADSDNRAIRFVREAQVEPPTFELPSIMRSVPRDSRFFLRLRTTGHPAPTFALQSGALPPGLSLHEATGRIMGTASSAGIYEATISATNQEGVATLSLAIAVSSLPAWADYLANAAVPPHLRGADADPDLDGWPNLVEYAPALDPLAADGGAALTTTRTEDRLQLRYIRHRPELIYTVEANSDLRSADTWTPAGVNQGTPLPDGSVTASAPLGEGTIFLRLRVTVPETP